MELVRQNNPLIHCMTNDVVMNFTANGLLAIGASPVMAFSAAETEDMASVADALLLNIGTPSNEGVDSMVLAGKAANKAGKPVIFDPVGVGATPFRNEISKRILNEVDVAVVRGNAGEIAALLGEAGTVKGVDGKINADVKELCLEAAKSLETVVVVTGEVDAVSNGEQLVAVANGHEWLTKVVGTGCLLGGVIAAYAAVQPNSLVDAAVEALAFYGVCAEQAYKQTKNEGIGSFQQTFLNELGNMTDEKAAALKRVEQIC
ncbi:hydroxyethylthiazole kinase [Shouchella clausii]|uniref:hydroxyethylthiazole kinase n=1 Tax=Shouchella clausii TaxID=79880 RepID=UPI000BA69CDB|nr:hydroxyethylthiazole kinase [Shouchella clausii]PAD91686.1 hydroxyethylthiazole kinase [Shouchella clausii]